MTTTSSHTEKIPVSKETFESLSPEAQAAFVGGSGDAFVNVGGGTFINSAELKESAEFGEKGSAQDGSATFHSVDGVPDGVRAQVDVINASTDRALAEISSAQSEMREIVKEVKTLSDELERREVIARSPVALAFDALLSPSPDSLFPGGPVMEVAHGNAEDVRTDIRLAESRFGYLAARIAANQGIVERNRAKLGRWSQMWPGIQAR